MISRSDCAFSQREMVGCEREVLADVGQATAGKLQGRNRTGSDRSLCRPGSRCKVADTLASHMAERRDPSHVAHTVADILGARRLARRWVPAFNAGVRGKSTTIERGWDFLARNGWQAEAGLVIFCHGGLPRSTLCSDNRAAKEECQQRHHASAGRRKKNEGKHSSQAKCSEEIEQVILLRGGLRYDHRVALRVNFS